MSENVAVAKETNDPVALDAAVEKRTDDGTDLDSLIAQFEQGTKPVDSPPEPKQPSVNDQTLASIRFLEQRVRQEDVSKAVSNIFRDVEWDDDMKQAWLISKANKNPAIEKAFDNRFADPGTWQKFEKALAKEADKYRSKTKVDEEATADHAAVAQAVRGASSTRGTAEPPPDLSKMSDAELRKYTQENWGFST